MESELLKLELEVVNQSVSFSIFLNVTKFYRIGILNDLLSLW